MIDKRRGEARSLPCLEPQILPQRVRDDEDVGKKDRAVETETPDRLQRHFGRRLGIVAKLEETALGFPQRAIFGQIASGLAHQPQRGPVLPRPAQRCQQALRRRHRLGSLSTIHISLKRL